MSDVSLTVRNDPQVADAVARREAIAVDLDRLVKGDVRFDRHNRMLYATDASIYQVEPIGVVIPADLEDALRAITYCCEHEIPMLPRGGGTSLAGQTVNVAVVIDFSRWCNRLLDVNGEAKTARVEPGMILEHLNDALAEHGLMFGPDVATAAQANLGGMIGNNSAGAHSVLYGRTVEHVRALDVVLANGERLHFRRGTSQHDDRVRELTQQVADIVLPIADEIRTRYPKTIRHVDGYNLDLMLEQIEASSPGTFDQVNLAHLFCGAEGTLGITLGAKIDLVDAPKHKGLAIVAFDDVQTALNAVQAILQTQPAAVELLDDVIIDLAKQNSEYRRYLRLLPGENAHNIGAILYVEYFADDQGVIHEKFDALDDAVNHSGIVCYTDHESMMHAWKLRKAGEPLLYGKPGARKPLTFIEDTAVDPASLPAFINDFRSLLERNGTTAAYYAHASVGCLHIRPMIALRDPEDRRRMQRIAEQATDLVKRYGGALSGEHGDGRLRSSLLRRFYGDQIVDAFQQIKSIFDPHNLMNPGNLVEPAQMDQHLRVKPEDGIIDFPKVDTFFRYEREQGFREAVEMCNGAGVCRKTHGGTMCPSYHATLDERHTTRGRGNALRLAISGQFSTNGNTPAWNDPDTLETLDLCLSCKGCKAECPSNVDLARLKAEYLAQRFRAQGRVPLNTRMFAHIRTLNQLGSAIYPIANALNRFPPARMIMNRVLNIHPQRGLPSFGPSLFRWFTRRGGSHARREAPAVVLFADCFTSYNEPHIARAAVRTLEHLGYRVILPRVGCCGRPHISTGALQIGLPVCKNTAAALNQCVQRRDAVAVVGLEPSCVSSITDDWQDLNINVDRHALADLAERTALIEQFITNNWANHPHTPQIIKSDQPNEHQPSILMHGHCHQKALWGVDDAIDSLKRFAGRSVRAIDAGCCGMAGSFGYTRDHYDLSMKIGNLALFPAIHDAPEATILAPGTSCRHQIAEGTDRVARHPIEFIAQAMAIDDDDDAEH